jgi:hypothetical protein
MRAPFASDEWGRPGVTAGDEIFGVFSGWSACAKLALGKAKKTL